MKSASKITIMLCCLSALFGLENDKIYLTGKQIYIKNGDILVNFNENFYPVTGLYKDTQGLYVKANEMENAHTFSWTCPLGHPSNGSGMCAVRGCPYERK